MSWNAKVAVGIASTVGASILLWVGASLNSVSVTMGRFDERLLNQSASLKRLEDQQGGQYTVAQARSDQLLIQADIAALRGRVEALEKRAPH